MSENCKNCSGCTGCGSILELTDGEIRILRSLGQFAFLPVGRKAGDLTPVYREEGDPAENGAILQCLEQKGLIAVDFGAPLAGADMKAYGDCPLHGSMALTAIGQQVLEQLETQGIE